jgi:hypothetical protein
MPVHVDDTQYVSKVLEGEDLVPLYLPQCCEWFEREGVTGVPVEREVQRCLDASPGVDKPTTQICS